MTAAIRLTGVEKRFRDTVAVRDFDLTIEPGILCGFLGPNGAGKSTTIRMIMSIIEPDAGRVEVFGGSALDAKDRIGYLPEERGLYRKMKVGDFLRYIARLKGVDRAATNRRIGAWLERIELPGVVDKRCEELSKGMQQKVQFVSSVIHGPDLLILDEPFSGLDPVNARVMSGIVREISETGATIIFSTHQMIHAEQLCDRVLLINRGEKILDASLEEVRTRFNPRTIVVEPLASIGSNGSLEAFERSLAALAGVDRVDWLEGRRAFAVHLASGGDPHAVMAAALAIEEGAVRAVELSRVSLDDVFVELVGGGQQPSEALAGGD